MLNIPTKINKGTVEITSNVALIKAGDKVGASEATLLAKLGIKPFSYGLIVKYVSCHLSSSSKWLFLYLSSFTSSMGDAQQQPADSHTLQPSLLLSLWVVLCKAAALQVSVTLPVQPVILGTI